MDHRMDRTAHVHGPTATWGFVPNHRLVILFYLLHFFYFIWSSVIFRVA